MTTAAPGPRRSPGEQSRLESELRTLFEHRITFNEVLGMKVVSFDPSRPRVRFEMRPDLVGHYTYGRLHGGAIAAVLDGTGGFALMVAMGEKHPHESAAQVIQRFSRVGTIDLRVDFLRQGLGRWFEASAQVTRLGGRIGSVQTELHSDDGTLIATGAAAYMVS